MAEAPPAYGLPEQFMGQSQPILLPPGLVPLPPGYFPPGFVPPGFPVGPNGVPLPMSPPLLNPATGEIVFLPAFAPPPFAPGGESLPPGQFPPAFFPPLGIDPNAPMMQSGFPIQGAPAPAIQLNKVEQAPAPISLDKAPEFREPEFCGASSTASRNNSEIGWANATKVIGPENKYGKMISSTLNSEKRRITNENLTWLYYWTGANVLEDSPNLPDIAAYTAKFNARLKFLKDSWNDEHFRPFETISSAEMIIRARQLVYLMRLSTSTPGCITASRWNDQYNQPSHKRFEIDSYSRLIGDNQVFSNITDFSKSFGAALQKS